MTLFEPDAARTDSLFPYDLGTLPLTPVAELNIPRELAPGVIAYPIADDAELDRPDPETDTAATITGRLARRAAGRTSPLPATHHTPAAGPELDDTPDPVPAELDNTPETVAARRAMFDDFGWTR